MKKILLALLLLTFTGNFICAQNSKVRSATNYKDGGQLAKALESIEIAVDPNNEKAKKSIVSPKTWIVRGEVFRAIATSKKAEDAKLSEKPLVEAYNSFMKAMEIDEKGKYKSNLKINLTFMIQQDLPNAAIKAFNDKKFDEATDYFEKILTVQATDIFREETPVDTVIMYNAAISAANAKMYEKAIGYFKECIKHDYNGGASYGQIINAYKEMGDTLKSVEIMKEGVLKYPEEQMILFALINYYIETNDSQEAITYLDKAIKKEPDNPTLYFAKGTALEKLERMEEALEVYHKTIEIDPDFANAYYNIGVYYYNQGVNQFNKASAVPPNEFKLYEKEKAKADEEFEKAVPYMEKAMAKNPDDTYIKEQLVNLYYRLKMMDKYNELKDN